MAFEITIESNTPLTGIDDLEEVALNFLKQIGFFPKSYDSKASPTATKKSVPYRMFVNCFLKRLDRPWTIEELEVKLKASKPTVYRHINKLKSLDLLEDVEVEDKKTGQSKKAFQIRYGDLSKAWNFVEAHVEVALENYRKTVDHLQQLSDKR